MLVQNFREIRLESSSEDPFIFENVMKGYTPLSMEVTGHDKSLALI